MRKTILILAGLAMLASIVYVVTKPIVRPDPMAPIVFIEDGTDRCLTAYEPDRDSFHACWPMMPEGVNRQIVPKGTTSLDIFINPDLYLPER